MPDTVHRIPLAEIDDSALTRDRSGLDEAPLDELKSSIALNGLRMPVELWRLSEPRGPGGALRYGLLSGLRRVAAFRELHEMTEDARYAAIPAFLRAPGSIPEALASMVEENEIRVGLSPWERGRIAWAAHRQEIFGTLDEAVEKLYPAARRQKRARLRAAALVVDELGGILTAPELLNEHRLMRISRAIQCGFGEIMREALESSSRTTPEAQWELILPYLLEAEEPLAADAAPSRPGRPRRLARIRRGLILRRARTAEGWVLYFAGPEATSEFVSEIIDEIERMFGR